MVYRKKVTKRKTLGKPVEAVPIPGYDKMIRAKRMAEVQMFREDLRQAELRRNYTLELGKSDQLFMGVYLQVFNIRYIPDETGTKRWFSKRSKPKTSWLHYSSA